MKKIFILLTAATIGFTSCSDFLDQAPLEELSDASFWKTIDDAKMFTGDVYRSLPTYNFYDGDVSSDDIVHGIKWAEGNTAVGGVYDPNDTGWSSEYEAIRKCNITLEKIVEVEASEEEKNLVIAEARALRGYFYFKLIQKFGDVPYVSTSLDLDELDIARTPIAEVYAKTKEDLEYAASILPATYAGSSSSYGRITAGAALTILADMQSYFATFPATSGGLTYGFVTHAEAAATAKRVIDLGVYDLFDEGNANGNFEKLFWHESDGDNEIIFARPFTQDMIGSGLSTWASMPGIGWGGVNPTQSLVEAFEDKDGAPIAKSTIYNSENPFEDRDPRLSIAVIGHGQQIPEWLVEGVPFEVLSSPASPAPRGIGSHRDATASGYYQKKHLDRSYTYEGVRSQYFNSNKDITIYRFAEVLLLYAYAVTEDKKAITPEALEAVNRIRRRVGQPELQNTNAALPTYLTSVEDFRQRIQNEYRVELAIEGKRFWAIRRFRDAAGKEIALKVMNEPILGMPWDPEAGTDPLLPIKDEEGNITGYEKGTVYKGNNIVLRSGAYKEANIRYPIPQSQIDLNSNITQNDGYN